MGEYHIYIHLPSEEEQESAMAGANTASTGGNLDDGTGSAGANRIIKAAKNMVSFSAIKSTADQIINYKNSTISLRTGAVEYEQRVSAVYSAISQTVGAGAALYAAGAAAGPAGIAAALIGLTVNGIRTGINILQRENTIRLNESLEYVSIGMQNIRAGTVGRRGGNQ